MLKYRISPYKKKQIKHKEQNFVLDCTNPITSKLPSYNSLQDQFLKYYVIRVSKKKLNNNRKNVSAKENQNKKVNDNNTVYVGYFPKDNIRPSVNKNEFDQFLKRKKQCLMYESVHRQYKQKRFANNTSHAATDGDKLRQLKLNNIQSSQQKDIERPVTEVEQMQGQRNSKIEPQGQQYQMQQRKNHPYSRSEQLSTEPVQQRALSQQEGLLYENPVKEAEPCCSENESEKSTNKQNKQVPQQRVSDRQQPQNICTVEAKVNQNDRKSQAQVSEFFQQEIVQ